MQEMINRNRRVALPASIPTKKPWTVRLGREEWQRHTYKREVNDGLKLLGSVKHGARVGALAVQSDGSYVQVNGDYVSPLKSKHVRQAVARAMAIESRMSQRRPVQAATPRANEAPVVVVKRRRLVSTELG